MNDQGDKGGNVMQLIMDLEGKVREKNEEIAGLRKTVIKLVGYKIVSSHMFWLGWIIGTVGSLIGTILIVKGI
jgi:hypothetical protein